MKVCDICGSPATHTLRIDRTVYDMCDTCIGPVADAVAALSAPTDAAPAEPSVSERICDIFRDHGQYGLTMDELVRFGAIDGLQEAEIAKALKSLSDEGRIFKNPFGLYKEV